MSQSDPASGLQSTEILSSLGDVERSELAARLETIPVKRGDVLVRQGRPADAMFIVVSGRFSVTVDGRRAPITEIGPNQPIGEIAFLMGGRRTATVTAMRDSLVLRLGREDFETLCERNPDIWRSMTITLARRLAETTAAAPVPPDPRPRTIAIIPAGTEPVPERFTELFIETLTDGARTLVVTSATAPEVLGAQNGLDSPSATRSLNALETRYDFVVFCADPTLTAWSEKAIRHADLVLAVGRHAADPAPNPLEQFSAGFVTRDARRLVLVHDTRTRVTGTARWLDHRNVAMHHHVALDDREDFRRLVRFIDGSARGLVACGGGALCAAHVGVYKALCEAGLRFDIMGGTSAGSAMVAAFALNSTPDEIDRSIHDMFVTHKAMHRYTWPRYSILDHANFDRQLQRYFGGIDIEDLWLPFFAVSTNLSSYKLHEHRRGDLWTALRASASIPVLLPPIYTDDGQMLVDGCLLDNVPIKVMHDLKSGPNVVVSFLVPELERFNVDYRALPTRSQLVGRALNPLKRTPLPEAPGLATVLMRALMANRHDFQRHLHPDDVLLVPPISAKASFLDWGRHSELLAAAHRWTGEEIVRLEKAGRLAGLHAERRLQA